MTSHVIFDKRDILLSHFFWKKYSFVKLSKMKNLKLLLLTLLVALSVNLQAQSEHEIFAKDGNFWEVCPSSYSFGVSVVAVIATSRYLEIPDSLKYQGVTYPVNGVADTPPKYSDRLLRTLRELVFQKA